MNVSKNPFGKVDGVPVGLYTLSNGKGMEMQITNYGGIVVGLKVPDKNGLVEDVVLGYDDVDGYVKNNPYFGAIIGRYGNRIANGVFSIANETYTLAKNNGNNCLHGGEKGFDKVIWNAKPIQSENRVGLELTYLSKDGEEGFPGNLDVKVCYELTIENAFEITYSATTDKTTVVNLTHHSYFNLAGCNAGSILSHIVSINADTYTPVDSGLIPTGEIAPVKETPFDFTKPEVIKNRIGESHEQLVLANGFDHNWILNPSGNGIVKAATVHDPASGRFMEVFTTEPAMQFYSGNFLDGTITGKGGTVYDFRSGLCLETQHSPDSPNHPNMPTTLLRPGEVYSSKTIYKFSTK